MIDQAWTEAQERAYWLGRMAGAGIAAHMMLKADMPGFAQEFLAQMETAKKRSRKGRNDAECVTEKEVDKVIREC